MSYSLSCFLFALLLALFTWMIYYATARWPGIGLVLPRERVAGAAIGCLCLIWSAWHVQLMLEGNAMRWRPAVWTLVPVITILSFFYLDYLFTRALAGLVLLVIPYLLHQAFAVHLTARPLFALVCYLAAITVMVMIAAPWYFRDFLLNCAKSASFRRSSSGIAAGITVFFLIYSRL